MGGRYILHSQVRIIMERKEIASVSYMHHIGIDSWMVVDLVGEDRLTKKKSGHPLFCILAVTTTSSYAMLAGQMAVY